MKPMRLPKPNIQNAQLHFSFISKQSNFIVTEATVRNLFQQFGDVDDIYMKKSEIDKRGEQTGYGFILFTMNAAGLKSALHASNVVKQIMVDQVLFDCCLTHVVEDSLSISASDHTSKVITTVANHPATMMNTMMMNKPHQGGFPHHQQQQHHRHHANPNSHSHQQQQFPRRDNNNNMDYNRMAMMPQYGSQPMDRQQQQHPSFNSYSSQPQQMNNVPMTMGGAGVAPRMMLGSMMNSGNTSNRSGWTGSTSAASASTSSWSLPSMAPQQPVPLTGTHFHPAAQQLLHHPHHSSTSEWTSHSFVEQQQQQAAVSRPAPLPSSGEMMIIPPSSGRHQSPTYSGSTHLGSGPPPTSVFSFSQQHQGSSSSSYLSESAVPSPSSASFQFASYYNSESTATQKNSYLDENADSSFLQNNNIPPNTHFTHSEATMLDNQPQVQSHIDRQHRPASSSPPHSSSSHPDSADDYFF
jgi:hypothetical protein